MFAVLSDGVSPEMNAVRMHVCSRVAGPLILQLVVIAAGQQIAPPSDPAPWSSAPPGKLAAESSQNQDRLAATDPARQRIAQPGRAGGSGDPALGGERHPLYRLSTSDTIDISFTLSPDLGQSLTIQPDGFVALRGAGTLFAEGLTVPQLQQAIVAAYRGILHDPEVTVTLKDFQKPYFLVSGEVARPGKYELRGDLTVHEAIAIAGGFTQQARHSQVFLYRKISADVAEAHLLDIKKMLHSHNLREDPHLEAGDFLFVPQSRISKIRRYVPTSAMNWYMNPLQF